MNKEEASKLIRAGKASVWNKYRQDNPDWKPDLSYEDLSANILVPDGVNYFDFSEANLCGTKFRNKRDYMTRGIKNAIDLLQNNTPRKKEVLLFHPPLPIQQHFK